MPVRLQNVDSWFNYVTDHNQSQHLGERVDSGMSKERAISKCLSPTVFTFSKQPVVQTVNPPVRSHIF